MPDFLRNIPSKIFYSIFISEILSYFTAAADLINIVARINRVLMRMKKQSCKYTSIVLLFKIIFRSHFKALLFVIIFKYVN